MLATSSASPFEAAWTLFAAAGLVVSITNVIEARRDRNVQMRYHPDDAVGAAYLHSVIVTDVIRATGLLAMVVIGLVAMELPPREGEHVTVTIAVIQGGITYVGLTLALNAWVTLITRRRLKRLAARSTIQRTGGTAP